MLNYVFQLEISTTYIVERTQNLAQYKTNKIKFAINVINA